MTEQQSLWMSHSVNTALKMVEEERRQNALLSEEVQRLNDLLHHTKEASKREEQYRIDLHHENTLLAQKCSDYVDIVTSLEQRLKNWTERHAEREREVEFWKDAYNRAALRRADQ